MADAIADFKRRLKTERAALARFEKAYRTYQYIELSPKAEREVASISAELESLIGAGIPERENQSRLTPRPPWRSELLERAVQLANHLQSLERCAWEFEPALTIGEWSDTSIDQLRTRVSIRRSPGAHDELLPLFHVFYCVTAPYSWGSDSRQGIRGDSPLTLVDEFVRKVVEAARTDPFGLAREFWNRARQFNLQRVLSLRVQRLSVSGTPERATAKLEFSNLTEALALPEIVIRPAKLIWPSHPTFPVPWRFMQIGAENPHERLEGDGPGTLYEESLGASIPDALIACAKWWRWVDEPGAARGDLETDEDQGQMDLSSAVAEIFENKKRRKQPWHPPVEDRVFALDTPDLPVVSQASLAAQPNPLALKAREIWFQRFREVLEPALPAARRGTLFLLHRGRPKSPFRTFVAKLSHDLRASVLERPACPECGNPCDVVVNPNFTHHDLEFRPPGTALVLHVCSEHNGEAEWWHHRWADRTAKAELEAILRNAEKCLAGPAVRVVEYDAEGVDRELTARPCAQSEAFNDRWEESYRMYASSATKVGGGVFWIQSNPGVLDSAGNPMRYIGQVSWNEFLEIFDSGIAYILYSPTTGETKIYTQFY